MKRLAEVRILLAVSFALVITEPARADWKWPTWLGGKPSTISKADNRKKAAAKPKSVNNFTSKNLFTHKPKGKVVSEWPTKSAKPPRKTSKSEQEGSWLSRMFTPSQPEPPRSVAEWMELDQIKP